MEPRLELDYRTPAAKLGADLGAEVPRYLDHTSLNDVYWRTRVHGEAGIWPGLSARASRMRTRREPIALGAPDDSTTNLAQTNRAGRRAPLLARAAGRSRADARRLGRALRRPEGRARSCRDRAASRSRIRSFRPDFSEGGGFAELRNPLGEDHALVLRGGSRYRSFDSLSQGEYLDAEGTLGLESRLPFGFDLGARGRLRLARSA